MSESSNPSETTSPAECAHANGERRQRHDTMYRPLIALQCLACGARLSEDISPKTFTAAQLAAMPAWDKEAAVRTKRAPRVQRQAEREQRQLEREAKREFSSEQRREEYNTYMRSAKWFTLRRTILLRANGVCEGCGRQAATQVHHLTYERFGEEMLFDLVAICEPCHASVHGLNTPPWKRLPYRAPFLNTPVNLDVQVCGRGSVKN